MKGYLIGSTLAVILTAIPFEMVVDSGYSHQMVLVMAMALAVVQIVVYLVHFLYLDDSFTQRWSVMASLFTLLTLVIVAVDSLRVMHNMNADMMTM